MASPKRSGQQIRKAYGKAPARGSDEWSRYGKTKQARMTTAAKKWSPEEDEYLLEHTSDDEYMEYKRKQNGLKKNRTRDALMAGFRWK